MMSSVVERLNEPKILDCAGTIKNPATCAAGLLLQFDHAQAASSKDNKLDKSVKPLLALRVFP
jgi:hypothetical protein